jgi:hypothetical protein
MLAACGGAGESPDARASETEDAGLDAALALDAASDAPEEAPDTPGPDARRAEPEDAAPDASVPRWFEDVARESGVRFVRGPAEEYVTLPDRMSGGVCVLDADGSGPVDLFFAMRPVLVDGIPSPAGSSRLFLAEGPLSYRDATASATWATRGAASLGTRTPTETTTSSSTASG